MKPEDLLYSATARCPCGAGLAYAVNAKATEWDCSAVLLGLEPADAKHPTYPFVFYSIKSEGQPSANGATTRPEEQGRVWVKVLAVCTACGHTWASELRQPNQSGVWKCGACPSCGNTHGADASTDSSRPTPINTHGQDWLVRPSDTPIQLGAPAKPPVKYAHIGSLRAAGLLQEINRRFLHPMGLALEVVIGDQGIERLGGIWDYRDDPEGMAFMDPPDPIKCAAFDALFEAKREVREAAFGWHVQPPGLAPEGEGK